MADLFQQWQVIVRIAIKPAVLQVLIVAFHPCLQARDFAVLKAGCAGDSAGVFAVTHFRFGGDEVIDSKSSGDRLGQPPLIAL